jgi:hypothetical protein
MSLFWEKVKQFSEFSFMHLKVLAQNKAQKK